MIMETDARWIQDSKFLHEKKWYCHSCGKVTAVELNPEWVKSGSPLRWKNDLFQWFARCKACGTEHLSGGDYCPTCGWNDFPEELPYIVEKRRFHHKARLLTSDGNSGEKEYPVVSNRGVIGAPDMQSDCWDEMHYCPWCHAEFTIQNSD